MIRSRSLLAAAALFLLGGAALAFFGLRMVDLERRGALEDAERRTRATLQAVATQTLQEAQAPSTTPIEAWVTWRLSSDAALPPPDGEAALLAATAEDLEQRNGIAGVADAEALYVRLAEDEHRGTWGEVAALRAGALRLRRGETAAAQRLLEIAAAAPPALLDPVGLAVRLLARYHLAVLDPVTGTGPFLAEAGEGSVLSPPGRLGPDDLVLALEGRRGPAAPRALGVAAARVRRGQRALAALPRDGVAVLDGTRVVRRSDDRLEARGAASLLARVAVPDADRLRIVSADGARAHDALAARLPPPLDALALEGRAPPPPKAGAALAGLLVGLGVYLLGAVLGLVAIHRAERAARIQSDFVAEVSHELKTPIASVRAMAEFLADGPADDEVKVREYARRIEGEMGRLGRSVRNVLDAARIERRGHLPVTLRPGDPADVVVAVADGALPGLAARGFHFDVRVEPAGKQVLFDAGALQSAVTNLVDNAAKFSRDARDVALEAGPEEDGYRIQVLDRGRGLGDVDPRRLFRRFVRGDGARKDAVEGVGLGLHVVREIVAAHHGRVRALRREGGGAVFVIDLPWVGGGASPS